MRAAAPFLFLAALAAQQPAEPPADAMRGRVVDENGAPVAGAAIGWFGWYDFVDTNALLADPAAVSGEDGTWELPLPRPASAQRLAIAAADRQACTIPVQSGAGALRDAGDVVLPPGERLVGRVRDAAGAPLAGVRVHVDTSIPQRFASGPAPRLCAGAVSNAKGIFVVPCVPRTGLRLHVEADGHLAQSLLVGLESPLDLTLEPVGVVRGRVVDGAGNALAGVSVRATTVERLDVPPVALSAADGTFVMTVPTRGRYRLTASEREPPHRQLHSRLLRGPATDVVVGPTASTADAADVELRVVDAATKQPLPEFSAAVLVTPVGNVQAALFHGLRNRKRYEGAARIAMPPQEARGLYVEAPGFGFEVVNVPDPLDGPFVVALGPEARLRARVVDEGTGEPMAGVAVRALPKGNTSGSGGSWRDAGPLTDANGEVVLRCLRPGDYGVQAHAEGRAASAVATVTLTADAEPTVALRVPKARFVEVEFTGAVPPGPVPMLRFDGGVTTGGHEPGFFQHSLADLPPVPLARAGRVRLGPLTPGRRSLQLDLPSRTRIGAAVSIALGDVDADAGSVTLALPELAIVTVQGRVELPSNVPVARVAVVATRCGGADARRSLGRRSVRATGVGGGGRFELDLPQGAYVIQLADLATGIVFHTEPEEVTVGAAELLLKPPIHWLHVDCEPAVEGADVVVHSFAVTVDAVRDAAAFLESWGGGRGRQSGNVTVRGGVVASRWLVPPGVIDLRAMQAFGALRASAGSWRTENVAAASVEITQAEHRVQFVIPAPPSDEELEAR